jgi:cobalt-zinc-cadmium efflux system outer membrane protein
MTTYARMTWVLLAGAALAAPARGQQAEAPVAAPYVNQAGGLALDDAIVMALEQEPSLRAARMDIAIARGLRAQAALRPNPTLTFERREEPTGTDNQTSVGLQWPLDLFRRSGRVQTADRALEATGFVASDRARLLVADVRMQYGAAAEAARDVEVADDIVATVRRQLDVVRARVETGRTPALERDLLEVELRRFEVMRVLAAGRVEAALVDLTRLLGMLPDQPLQIRDTLEMLVTGPASAPSAAAPTGQRSDVREADARVAEAEARIDQAEREGRVDVSLFANYMRMDAGFPQRGVDSAGELARVRGQFHYLAGGAMITLPFRDRNQGQVAAARAARGAAEARRDAADLAARAEVAAARVRDTRARQAIELYTGSVRALARKNLDVVQQTFDLGRATVFDVLAEQRRFLEIEQAYTDVLHEAWEARAALKRAQGET